VRRFLDGFRGTVEGLDAIGADLFPLRTDLCPLKIWLLAALSGGIIVATKKHTAGNHAGALPAHWTSNGHRYTG
jgi:hypothetical protein